MPDNHRNYVPEGEGWHKAPSVYAGGMPHFWARRNPGNGRREWYVWDRVHKQWIFQYDS